METQAAQGSRPLYDLLALKLGQEISIEAFCREFESTYNFGVSAEALTDEEERVFRSLFNVVVWYSPFPQERAEYPKHFKDEVQILEAVNHARRELGLQRQD